MLRLRLVVAALIALALVVAGSSSAKNRPKAPDASAVSQYVEMMPGAGGAKPSTGPAAPSTPSGSSAATRAGSATPKAPHKTVKPPAAKSLASAGPADPVSAAFGTTGGGLSGGALFAIILGAIGAAGVVVFAVRRRLSRQQSG
jgi:hypothetical protein